MVKHIVMWKLKDDLDKQQNIDRMIEMLKALVGQVKGLVSIEMGYNFNTSSEYDVVLYATLKSPAALKHYQNHPAHVKCKDFIGSITEARAVADYFYEDESVSAKSPQEIDDVPADAEMVSTLEESQTKQEPEIWIEFPPKREVLPAPQIVTIANIPEWEDPAPSKPHTPGKRPEIIVRRPPLWEPEVIPAETEASAEPAVEPAPMTFESVTETTPPEPAPMTFESISEAAPVEPIRKFTVPAKTPTNAQVNPVSTEHATIKEKTNVFGKKKLDVEVTPLDQRSDTWTCPNCGKIMPNYVGTCGCGEPKPFEFEPPMPSESAPSAPATTRQSVAPKAATPTKTPTNAQVNPVSTEHATIKEKTNVFGKKKLDVEVTPLDQRSDTWTCPNCGKIMPNYVGTCGCGEPKPFEFEPPMPSGSTTDTTTMPDILPAEKPKSKLSPEQMATFENVQPSIQGYNPQVQEDIPTTQGNAYSYIQNDTVSTATDPTYQAPDLSFIRQQDNTFNNAATAQAAQQDFTAPLDPFQFSGNEDSAPAPMQFDNLPPAAPMRFNDAPPAFLGIDPSKAPKASAPAPQPEKPKIPDYQRPPVDDFASTSKKKEKRPRTKKAKEADAFRKAQEAVNNRRDVPNDGTWTCPNCGKVMPKYVGTCGCGESQPFEF